MQNYDFYTGCRPQNTPPAFNSQNPEYFSKMAKMHQNHIQKNHKRANRLISVITGLCIISFTTGLVVGIKFTSNSGAEIVDNDTKTAVSSISSRFSNMLDSSSKDEQSSASQAKQPVTSDERNTPTAPTADPNRNISEMTQQNVSASNAFPKSEYPYVVQIEGKHTQRYARDIANYLSGKGQTVIIAQHNDLYNVYVGPFKDEKSASDSLSTILEYSNNPWFTEAHLIKR